MRISIIQDSLYWADKSANLLRVEEHLLALNGNTDLVVLPEMFTTGFCVDDLYLAESMDGLTVQTLRAWARRFNFAITGSFIATENDKVYNRAFFVFPNGDVETADKRHLFSMGGEQNYFSAGNKRMIVNHLGFNICILVCYDIRFPVWSRNVSNEYDLLIYVANFPQRRIAEWDVLLKARAIENQCYVCGVNRVGVDDLGILYNGHSILLDFKSNEILTFPDDETSVQTATLNIDPLKHYRDKFSVWKDTDEFELHL